MKRLLTIILLLLVCSMQLISAPSRMRYSSFDNLDGQTGMSQIRSFAQDRRGLIWFGTSDGLFSYDGHLLRSFGVAPDAGGMMTTSLQAIGDTLLVSCGESISAFDLQRMEFFGKPTHFEGAIIDTEFIDDHLWVGSEGGLYVCDNNIIRQISLPDAPRIKSVNSIDTDGRHVYVAAVGGVWRCGLDGSGMERFLQFGVGSALKYDSRRGCLWIGTESRLVRYDIETQDYEVIAASLPVVKALDFDDSGNVVVGTDSGLYVYDGANLEKHMHDAKDDTSLSGDVVWVVFKDKDGNMWLGSDNGISLSVQNEPLSVVRLSSLTGSSQGNEISSIIRDYRTNIWLSGNHGTVRTDKLEGVGSRTRWYQMRDPLNEIPHNHISGSFCDSKGNLFLLSDSGILYYDPETESFVNYRIAGGGMRQWCYDMVQDRNGDYWVASYEGLMKIPSDFLSGSRSADVIQSFLESDGLASNKIRNLVLDSGQGLWVLFEDGNVDRVNLNNGEIQHMPIGNWFSSSHVDRMILDKASNVWLAAMDRVVRIKPGQTDVDVVELGVPSTKIYAMQDAKDYIWVASSAGLVAVGNKSLEVKSTGINDRFLSIHYDLMSDRLWLGTSDKVAVFNPDDLFLGGMRRDIMVSSISISGETVPNVSELLGKRISLKPRQNDITINFSDLDYRKRKVVMFDYRCEGLDNEWHSLPAGSTSLHLGNLSPGKYSVYVTNRSIASADGQGRPIMSFRIRRPWYQSKVAVLLYLMALALAAFKLIEEVEARRHFKEEQKQSKAKLAFLTDVAHELKTPLSLIMAPLGMMMNEERSEEDGKRLGIMHANALKLSAMINRSIEIYRGGDQAHDDLLATEIEVVEFLKSIYQSFSEDQQYLKKDFVLNCDRSSLYLKLDILKLESIVTNLLSNACKYTPDGGSVILSSSWEGGILEIRVSDTGVGIPNEEIPFVFHRYFQSSRTSGTDKTGTGVGLSIVKTYVEQMGGVIDVASSADSGTTFTVRLPAEEVQHTESADSAQAETHDGRPVVVVVEDNISVNEMICDILDKNWRTVSAFNGRNGLKVCQEFVPDLIIADVMMPVMDGFEMCRKIRSNQQLASVPIILLTAKSDSDLEFKSAELGIDYYLPKPFDPVVLEARANQLLQSRKAIKKQVRIETISTPENRGETSLDDQFLMNATKIIENRLDDPDFSVSTLSEEMKTSSKQLYRKIKQLTGLSPVEYIRSIRMKKAALLFQGGRFTVAEVMYMVGFVSSSYFSSCFAKEFGMNPKDYIAANRQ